MRRKVDAVQVRMCEVSHSLMSQTKGGNTMEPCRLDGYYIYCGMNKHLWTRKVSLGEFKEMCKHAMTLEHLVAKVCVAAYARLYEGEMLGRMAPEIHVDSFGVHSLYSRSGTFREEVFADVNGDWEVHVNRPDNDSVLWATYTYSTDSIEYYRDGGAYCKRHFYALEGMVAAFLGDGRDLNIPKFMLRDAEDAKED